METSKKEHRGGEGEVHNVIRSLFIDSRQCTRIVMDVFYFEPRDPSSSTGKKGRKKKGGGRGEGMEQENWRAEREKVEEARGDGLAGANHLVCIHLRRILFLRSLLLPSTSPLLFFFFFFLFSIRLRRPSRTIHLRAKTDNRERERKKLLWTDRRMNDDNGKKESATSRRRAYVLSRLITINRYQRIVYRL